jgi:hypothetical protein
MKVHGELHTLTVLTPGKRPHYLWRRRLGGSKFELFVEQKTLFPLLGIKP